MTQVIRVSLPTYNALTDTNQDHYALYTDQDNVLIKEFARGVGSVGSGSDATITHSLGYIPFYLVFAEVASGQYQVANSFDPVGSGWRAYSTTTALIIQNRYSATFTDYRYYIFYDNIT